MIDYELNQTAIVHPARTEVAMMLIIIAILIINLAATIRTANYEPECVPAIVKTEETR